MRKKTKCPNCGHKTAGEVNLFGRLCMKCGIEILPDKDSEIPLISDNKKKNNELLEMLRKMLSKKEH